MKIEVKLYGDFLKYGPTESFVDLEDGSNIEDLLEILNINERSYIIILINLKRSWFEDVLNGGDVVSIFSPVGGG